MRAAYLTLSESSPKFVDFAKTGKNWELRSQFSKGSFSAVIQRILEILDVLKSLGHKYFIFILCIVIRWLWLPSPNRSLYQIWRPEQIIEIVFSCFFCQFCIKKPCCFLDLSSFCDFTVTVVLHDKSEDLTSWISLCIQNNDNRSSSGNKNKEVKTLMKEVTNQIPTVFPDFWAEGAVAADSDVDS